MEIYIDADVDLLNGIAMAWLLIGLVWSLIVLRMCARDQDDYEFVSQKLGIVILTAVIAWPYNLFCWIFSWPIWLTPIGSLVEQLKPGQDISFLINSIVVVLSLLAVLYFWFFNLGSP